MRNKINEDFGLDDRNFHPEEQRINWETMQNKDPGINEQQQFGCGTEDDLGNDDYTDQKNANDNSEANVKEQPIQPELDRDIDEELDKELEDFSDGEFDKKDKSDS